LQIRNQLVIVSLVASVLIVLALAVWLDLRLGRDR
jgi:hypothetical protein